MLDRASEDSDQSEHWIGEAVRCLQQAAHAEDGGMDRSECTSHRRSV